MAEVNVAEKNWSYEDTEEAQDGNNLQTGLTRTNFYVLKKKKRQSLKSDHSLLLRYEMFAAKQSVWRGPIFRNRRFRRARTNSYLATNSNFLNNY